jgi:hypothetical protein
MERRTLHTNIHRHERIQPLRRLHARRSRSLRLDTHLSHLLRHARYTTWLLITLLLLLLRRFIPALLLSILRLFRLCWGAVGGLLLLGLWVAVCRCSAGCWDAVCGCLGAIAWHRWLTALCWWSSRRCITSCTEIVCLASVGSLLLASSCGCLGCLARLVFVCAFLLTTVLLAVLIWGRHDCD